jgi:hypothetical protein
VKLYQAGGDRIITTGLWCDYDEVRNGSIASVLAACRRLPVFRDEQTLQRLAARLKGAANKRHHSLTVVVVAGNVAAAKIETD